MPFALAHYRSAVRFLVRRFANSCKRCLTTTGKQIILRSGCPPVVAQHRKQHWRQNRVAIFVSLALNDADHHAFAVDVGQLEIDDFRDLQPSRVGRHQNHAVLERRDHGEQTLCFVHTEYYWKTSLRAWWKDVIHQITALDDPAVEISKRNQGLAIRTASLRSSIRCTK